MRWTHLVAVLLLSALLYRLAPGERRAAWRGRVKELGRAVVLALVLFWAWMLLTRGCQAR